jgi:hypothetical protein
LNIYLGAQYRPTNNNNNKKKKKKKKKKNKGITDPFFFVTLTNRVMLGLLKITNKEFILWYVSLSTK